MALEHALLVALAERPAAGIDLARRFDKSIGFFWQATHQQIYRTLGRMEREGWVTSTSVPQAGGPGKKVYDVTESGRGELARWIATPSEPESLRSDFAVRLRGASYGSRDAILALVKEHLADHEARLAHYRHLQQRDYPNPDDLSGQQLDQYLVLRGGLLAEEFWISWLTEYLEAVS